jgi:hypothetical protein
VHHPSPTSTYAIMVIVKRLIKDISAGIGLASEAIAHNKEKTEAERRLAEAEVESKAGKNLSRSQSFEDEVLSNRHRGKHDQSSSESDTPSDYDDEDWALDDAAAELEGPPPTYTELRPDTLPDNPGMSVVDRLVTDFRNQHGRVFSLDEGHRQPLPCPVIIPQRRPKQKSRGFVRAYAPLLGECAGIDEVMFLDFLEKFDESSKASPIFKVINIAATAAGFVPSAIATAVSISIQVAATTAAEVQTRYRTNTFLDQVNESLFKPKGLYCLIMTFKPDHNESVLNADMGQEMAIIKAMSVPEDKVGQQMRKWKISSGETMGEIGLPEAAPLIFPAIDHAAAKVVEGQDVNTNARRSNKLKASGAFIADYLDRRAQAEYAETHSGSKLSVPENPNKNFASRFADPNHPVNSGSLVALLTGGALDLKSRKRERRAARTRRQRNQASWEEAGNTIPSGGRMGGRRRKTDTGERKGLVKRVLGQDILYLMIVNLPSESDLKDAGQQMNSND